MGVFLTLVRRELGMSFKSPTGFLVMAVVLGLVGVSLVDVLNKLANEPIDIPFTEVFYRSLYFWVILLTTAPAMTMRTFAGERSAGTYEALMTAPVGDGQVVLAKFTGSLLFYVITWSPLLAVFAVLRKITGEPSLLESGPTASAFLGITLIGSVYIAMGCLASALTRSQIIAAMASFLMGIALFVAGLRPTADNPVEGRWAAIADHISVIRQLNDFSAGIIDSRALVFLASTTLLLLYVTVRVVESRRWK
jgi:ABC-2 type transport system permease protein